MKFIDEYRDPDSAYRYSNLIKDITTKRWTIMEVCGGQTHAIVKFGIDKLIPDKIELLHGPGCPVCVTSVELIDKALSIASLENVIFCSFGDMLRVPGTAGDLLCVKAKGADVRVVYSPLDCLKIAKDNPSKKIVFFAVGFETTAPTTAMTLYQAYENDINNFSLLVSHVLVPPAIEAILSSYNNKVQGFLAAGHVCTVMGYKEYFPIAEKYRVPIVATGFEPLDLLQGIYMCIRQLEEGRHEVENQYKRSVRENGNLKAIQIIEEVFELVPRKWRGIGEIEQSGLGIKKKYESFDAEKLFNLESYSADESKDCISGLVLQGVKKPPECQAFGTQCKPEHPLGATMVSSEGACAAYYKYRNADIN
ncbi:MAG: hydrogenase formation protein HypD [Candidatus Dadabacteria bacterium]|nr:hydrogenase formation protein HypD [Candidatus Dadabacteria bacterium]NIS08452.1 hydrogenase formation protein HypD [Candidatus Dadabacteria bacterium]NIY21940.1 hydrogenase formation protein HypD [Candidatus Dadabacteria bacterium]